MSLVNVAAVCSLVLNCDASHACKVVKPWLHKYNVPKSGSVGHRVSSADKIAIQSSVESCAGSFGGA